MAAWQVLSRTSPVDDRWLRVHAERVQTEDGSILDPYYRLEERTWACVVPVLPDGRLLLVEQYRHGLGRRTLELPAGDLDEGERPVDAALRELAEETGHTCIGEPLSLGALCSDPSRSNGCGHGFLAHISGESAGQQPQIGETIVVQALTPAALLAAWASGDFVHACHVAFVLQALRMAPAAGIRLTVTNP